jgi:hypothetical protein
MSALVQVIHSPQAVLRRDMIRIPKVTMTMRDLDRFKCIQGLIDEELKRHGVDLAVETVRSLMISGGQ